MGNRLSHVVGFDDGAFDRAHRGDVMLIGAVFAGLRLDGVLHSTVRRDGVNATRKIIQLISGSRFAAHLQLILLQGVAVAGFNVIDLHRLYSVLDLPVVAIARRRPDMAAIKRALHTRVSGGERKWRLIEQLGPMEPVAGVFVQRAGISMVDVEVMLQRFAINGVLPEPLRVAHLIASGVALGESRHRP